MIKAEEYEARQKIEEETPAWARELIEAVKALAPKERALPRMTVAKTTARKTRTFKRRWELADYTPLTQAVVGEQVDITSVVRKHNSNLKSVKGRVYQHFYGAGLPHRFGISHSRGTFTATRVA